MRKIILTTAAIIITTNLGFSQGTAINANGANPDNSALLDLSSTTQGFAMPRMTTAQRNAISSPVHALQIFNTTTDCYEGYNANISQWVSFGCIGCQLPGAFSALSATNIALTSFTANWNASAGATSYRLDVATDTNFTNFVAGYNNLNVNFVTSYNVTGLGANTYYYRLRAVNICGTTTNSNRVSVLSTNLVGYWKLDETSGNAADAVGSNTGVATNITYSLSDGKINNGAHYNGADGKIIFNTIPQTASTSQAATYTVWFKSTAAVRQHILTMGDLYSTNDGMQLFIYTDYKLHLDFAGVVGPSTSNTVIDGIYHFAAVVLNNGIATLYYDGNSLGSFGGGNLRITGNGTNTRDLGGPADCSCHWFNGSLDEAGVWSRALTANEISALYKSGAGLAFPF